jgi:uncharacterized membrane protein
MSTFSARDTKLERWLALVLHYGTWLASSVVAVGLILPSGTRIVTTGIALFIALPVVRVSVMLLGFLRRRDLRLGAVAAVVLAIIALGFLVGMRTNTVHG